ncbi:hypothetical protein J23TS9_06420 [Paenibacillus sp. J23TS9]|uniref:hypothetical protein n=1 Tax=Paenibacillus sp. J23TS9 TaxID=2807193 RepID=UPI001B02C7C8|nr:hypothetical protein [Paenibacillus sp. J23TS9]GIP25512.1 hypothetical protein J23TS9_06420 [Paenibacillus sp. J23TS9]
MIKTVTFQNYRYFSGPSSDAFVIRRIENEQTIRLALPFHEDTPNIDLTISESLNLRNALEELIDLKLLKGPSAAVSVVLETEKLFPETFVTIADQSRLSALFEKFSGDTRSARRARSALKDAIEILGLRSGVYEY